MRTKKLNWRLAPLFTKMKNKSQIQIGETIAVLFVFFILVGISFIFYAKVIKSNLETDREELSQMRSIGIAQGVMFLPELQCSEDNVIRENCIDLLKLQSAKEVMSSNIIHYYDLLDFTEINITQIYPEKTKWELYSRRIQDYNNRYLTNVPVSLYDPIAKTYSFGILSIETFDR